jgi:hypothetical protein
MARGRPSRLAVFDRLDRAVAELYHVGGLPHPSEAEDIWDGIWYEETHSSTAIEGNTLVLREVKTLLEEGRAVGEKELREYLEVQGYGEAAQWVYRHSWDGWHFETDPLLSKTELREIHRRCVEPVWRHFPPADHDPHEGPGSFRRHDIKPFSSGMQPPPWPDVPPQVDDWLIETQTLKEYIQSLVRAEVVFTEATEHPMAHLADLHAWLERIHPFRDGNGRTGRLVLNLLLVRLGYPPAVIHKTDRLKYLRSLEWADRGDVCSLGEIIARAVTYGIDRFLLPALAGPQRIIPISALVDKDLSLIALRRAAERGRLSALRRQDQWYSTRKWVNEYKASRKRGQPIPLQQHRSPRSAEIGAQQQLRLDSPPGES